MDPIEPQSTASKSMAQTIPSPIANRLRAWRCLWVTYATLDYILGGSAVLCASLSAAKVEPQETLAAVSAALIALLGFLQPGKRYYRVVQAWRMLDAACIRFQLGEGTTADLIEAMTSGERLLSKLEQSDHGGVSTKASH